MNPLQWTLLILAADIVFDVFVILGIRKGIRLYRQHKKNWGVYELSDNEVHTIPRNDLVIHEKNDDCACSPKTEPVPRADGSVGWLVRHNALDGRE